MQDVLLQVRIPKTGEYVDVHHRIDELVLQLAMPEATEGGDQGMMAAGSADDAEEKVEK